jgi:DNA polymerase elongation subunit (family B)
MHQLNVYGLDIETDTTHDGLDPAVAAVRAVALSSRAGDELFLGDEADLIRALDRRLATLPVGVLATWNGATFDLPFLADRARILGLDLGLRLCLDRSLTLRRTPLPGHAGAYRGTWHGHGHLDTFRLYGQRRVDAPRPTLRSLGRRFGIGASVNQQPRHHDLTNEALHAHAPSDARLARVLAERRGAGAIRFIDHVADTEAEEVAVAARRLARRDPAERVVLRPVATI